MSARLRHRLSGSYSLISNSKPQRKKGPARQCPIRGDCMTTENQKGVLLPRGSSSHQEGSAHRRVARSTGSAPAATPPTGHDHPLDIAHRERGRHAKHHANVRAHHSARRGLVRQHLELILSEVRCCRRVAHLRPQGTVNGDREGPALSHRHPATADAGRRRSWMLPPRPLPCARMVHIRATVSDWRVW